MKIFHVVLLASVFAVAGCTTTSQTSAQTASATEESYVPLGSAIARKKTATSDDKTVNLQQLQNERDMSGGTNNAGH